MHKLLSSIRRFLAELRRRNVYQVAVTYVIVGVFVIEAADLTLTRLGLPPWTVTFVIVLVGLGFPIALVMAWALEVTPEGVQVEDTVAQETDKSGAVPAPTGTTRDLWVGGSVLVLLLLGAWWVWGGLGSGDAARSAQSNGADIQERSVAVLPFESLNPAQESKTLANGIHGDLITRLSNVSALLVKSGESAERYRESQFSLPTIADTLGARWIVNGEVQQVGDQIQVRAQLINPENDANVWAENYRRALTGENLFAIQDDITQEIVNGLQAELTADEQARITGAPTKDLEAYRLYVKGRQLLNQRNEKSVLQARTYFERALRRDSTYALAWSGLADSRGLMPFQTADSSATLRDTLQAAIPAAEAAARRALDIAPTLAEAHASMGYVYLLKQEGPRSFHHLRRAVELKPSYAQAHHWLGGLQMMLGQPESALEQYALTIDLNPLNRSVWDELIRAQMANGKYEAALQTIRDARQRHPEAQTWKAWRIHVFAESGQWDKLRETLRQSCPEPEMPDPVRLRTQVWSDAVAGDTSSARRHFESIRQVGAEWPSLVAEASVALGNEEVAISALRTAEGGGASLVHTERLRYSRLLDPLRDDPRFETLIQELNRAWGLNPDGSIPEDTEATTDLQSDA